MSAEDIINDIHTVLKAASSKCKVLEESFPVNFYEKNPDKIYESYCTFVESKVSDKDGNSEDEIQLTTISKKFENNEYMQVKNGFYMLYHDIRLVCTLLIHFYPQGCRQYQIIDKFYKFSSELLLRECYKLGVSLSVAKGKGTESEILSNPEITDLDKLIVNDFIKISTNYKVNAEETYHITTRDNELFSSIIGRSILDKRARELPNNDFEINKIMPQTNIQEDAPKLGFIAANTSNIPDPTFPPTEMMTRFLHPNWYSLPIATWLDYGHFKSWAPFFTANNTVSNINDRGKLWLERVGYIKLFNEKSKNETEDREKEDEIKDDEVKDEQRVESHVADHLIKEEKSTVEHTRLDINPENIKLSNLINWTPSNIISEEDIESFKNNKQSQQISKILKQLHNLRNERKKDRYVTKPSTEEQKLYYRAKILLREVMIAKSSKSLPIKSCNSFPILQTNYNGTIPVVRSHGAQKKRKYKK